MCRSASRDPRKRSHFDLTNTEDEETPSLSNPVSLSTSSSQPVEAGVIVVEGADRDYTYTEMLERVFSLLREKNPALAGNRKKASLPPPQLSRVGTRKTMWSNFAQICQMSAPLSIIYFSNSFLVAVCTDNPSTFSRSFSPSWVLKARLTAASDCSSAASTSQSRWNRC